MYDYAITTDQRKSEHTIKKVHFIIHTYTHTIYNIKYK